MLPNVRFGPSPLACPTDRSRSADLPLLRRRASCHRRDRQRDAGPRAGTASDQPRNRRLSIIALVLMGIALTAILGVYKSIPVKELRANAPDETAEAIRDLQKSHRQAADQLGMLQQTVSSNRAEMKRLSDEVTALTAKS